MRHWLEQQSHFNPCGLLTGSPGKPKRRLLEAWTCLMRGHRVSKCSLIQDAQYPRLEAVRTDSFLQLRQPGIGFVPPGVKLQK
jgi:hypothetical protein